MFRRLRHRRRYRSLSQQCRQQSLARYMAECAEMDVDKLINTPLISVDLELTGLDARQHQIISIGWTHVDRGRVSFASNRNVLINADHSVGHTAAIHEILDSDLAQGVSLEDGIQHLFEAARGCVWLFHHASLDVAFLQKACVSWAVLRRRLRYWIPCIWNWRCGSGGVCRCTMATCAWTNYAAVTICHATRRTML